jgi:hypothetical protein
MTALAVVAVAAIALWLALMVYAVVLRRRTVRIGHAPFRAAIANAVATLFFTVARFESVRTPAVVVVIGLGVGCLGLGLVFFYLWARDQVEGPMIPVVIAVFRDEREARGCAARLSAEAGASAFRVRARDVAVLGRYGWDMVLTEAANGDARRAADEARLYARGFIDGAGGEGMVMP